METNLRLLMFTQHMDNQASNNIVLQLQTQDNKCKQNQSNILDYLLKTPQILMETNLLIFTQLNLVSKTIS